MRARALLRRLFPVNCMYCKQAVCLDGEPLCPDCKKIFETLLREPCFDCGMPAAECICKHNQAVHALLWYNLPQVKQLVYMIKHRADRVHIDYLARLLAELCSERYDAVTFVPRSRKNLRKEGFDQSKLLAQAVAEQLGLPVVCTLRCLGLTEQKFLSASQRYEVVKGKYEVIPAAVAAYPRLLLIDDICTTGATLRACSGALRKAGAKSVFCAALAKTQLELP